MTDPVGPIQGHLDSSDGGCLVGWAYDPADPQRRVIVEVIHDGTRLCMTTADQFRPDLRDKGHGDGNHGFRVTLPSGMFAEQRVVLRVCVAPSGLDLKGSPVLITNERPLYDDAYKRALSRSIADRIATAQTAEELDDDARLLLEGFGLVYQRQIVLAESEEARWARFESVVGANTALPDLVRHTMVATRKRYPRLEFPAVSVPIVTVIIPAFNHFGVTYRCLQSIVAHMPVAPFDVILVDDGSQDETLYAGLVISGGIQIIRNAANVGFLHSVAAAARVARGGLLLLLNNDCEVKQGWLDSLVDTMTRDSSIGIVGSKLLFPDGRLQEAGGIIWRDGSGHNYGRGENSRDPRYCFMRDVDYVSGAALMVRRDVFEAVGGLAEEFAPGYYEDTDLCFKVRATGYRVVVQPGSQVVHYEGVSAGTDVDGPGMKRFQLINHGKFLRKWTETLQAHAPFETANLRRESERCVTKRALFIDETVATPDRDAGSNAAVDHMLSLQRLGFKVSFIGADNVANISPYTEQLERLGIENYYAPFQMSVEQVLRDAPAEFDLVYLHRFANATKYTAMIRQYCRDALLLYNVADLHHLRLDREAEFKLDPVLREQSAGIRHDELAMVVAADSVIVHSRYEAGVLAHVVPQANVHVVPWSQMPRPIALPFDQRQGLMFIGGYNHTPNIDAALWLVNDIMPVVWARRPEIECLLVGSDMPRSVVGLAQKRVRVIGHLPKLDRVLSRVRLTVAPLRFGAGLKGKVLTSLSAGLPCIATPCAVEGMDLPPLFDMAIAASAEGLASRILALYENEEDNLALAEAGLNFVGERFSQAVIDELLRSTLQRRAPRETTRILTTPILVSPVSGKAGRRPRS